MNLTISKLKDFTLFNKLDKTSLDFIEKTLTKKTFPKDHILFSEGENADNIYLICSGLVETRSQETDNRHTIETVGPGGAVGEVCVLTGERYNETAVVKEETTVLIISNKHFENLGSASLFL